MRFPKIPLAIIGVGLFFGATTYAQNPVGVTAAPTYCPSTGQTIPAGTPGNQLDALCPPASSNPSAKSSSAANMKQALANAGATAILDFIGGLLSGNKNDQEARNRAAAAAAAAEQERQAELARHLALEEQRRQQMFDRLSRSLKLSGLATLSMKGFDNNPGLHLKGLDDTASASGGDLHLKGIGDSAATSDTSLQPKGTTFFGLGGDAGTGPSGPEPTGDSNVVDLRDLQEGVDLAVVAANGPPGDQQLALDQALDIANGDKSIQFAMISSTAIPVVNQDGLLAFQKANAEYRRARDTSYQHRKSFEDAQKRCAMVDAVARVSQAQLEADLKNNIDHMTLAQKQEAMAKILQATLDQDLACGNESARLALALQNTDWARYQAEGVLAKIAQVQPPSPPKTQSITDEDLKLLLPDEPMVKDPAMLPKPSDMELVRDMVLDQPLMLPTEGVTVYPPAFALTYRTDLSFAQAANTMHAAIFENLSKDYRAAAREATDAWQKGISDLTQKGLVRSNVPLDAQESANTQLHLQLDAMRKEVTSRLDYECTLARYQAENAWSNWVESQDAKLTGKPEPLYRPLF